MTVQTTAAMLRPACMADVPAVVDIANACARETDGRVIAHHLYGHHGHSLGLSGIHLARHNR